VAWEEILATRPGALAWAAGADRSPARAALRPAVSGTRPPYPEVGVAPPSSKPGIGQQYRTPPSSRRKTCPHTRNDRPCCNKVPCPAMVMS
jgi:hypothetical protein